MDEEWNLLVLGTGNLKKGEELIDLLSPCRIELATLSQYPGAPEVEEVGRTFAENAAIKAAEIACALDEWVLGEDSGLAVSALDGRPGIFSARYSGEHATDQKNNEKLIQEMESLQDSDRDAYYVCSMAVSDPKGQVVLTAEGVCHGRITRHPHGDQGFGYDPFFLIQEYHQTFAELGLRVKHHLSHRARAVRQLIPKITALRGQ